jgi:hypothetical protein
MAITRAIRLMEKRFAFRAGQALIVTSQHPNSRIALKSKVIYLIAEKSSVL